MKQDYETAILFAISHHFSVWTDLTIFTKCGMNVILLKESPTV